MSVNDDFEADEYERFIPRNADHTTEGSQKREE